ncbi:MAG: hypothetical protein JWN48_5408 [Myxococcaceae bacterium]|nr:hypothetical protein [Myxococcaceae bacterium]
MPKPKILVVDDDRDIRDAVAILLRDNDFEVVTADNGRDALTRLRMAPDVQAIVLDVAMPEMNGATFRGEQLADPRLASIPLVLLTGRSDFGPLATALGAAACLHKPFESAALLRALSASLRDGGAQP